MIIACVYPTCNASCTVPGGYMIIFCCDLRAKKRGVMNETFAVPTMGPTSGPKFTEVFMMAITL